MTEAGSGRNLVKLVFIVVCILAGLYFVVSLLALIFPEWGIPFVWVAFPIGPQPPPVS